MGDFCLNGAFSSGKRVIFELNLGFLKGKWVIFPIMGVFEGKMRDFRVKWGNLVAKAFDLGVKWGIFEEKMSDFCLNA